MKKLSVIFVILALLAVTVLPVFAEDSHYPRVLDYADLLTDEEEAELEEYLAEVSEEIRFDLVAVTTDDTGYMDSFDYAIDVYEKGGYGYGSDYSGALFLINMEAREMFIIGTGSGEALMNDARRNAIFDYVEDSIKDGDYKDVFDSFAVMTRRYVIGVDDYYDSDYDSGWDSYYEPSEILLPAFIIGLIAGAIALWIAISKMKSVRAQRAATNYVIDGSMHIDRQADIYLYSTVSKVAKPKDNDSGSGGARTSSSGRSYSGGGRSF